MNIRDVFPRGAPVLAVIAGCPLLIFALVAEIFSREPVLPDKPWTDGSFWP